MKKILSSLFLLIACAAWAQTPETEQKPAEGYVFTDVAINRTTPVKTNIAAVPAGAFRP